MNIFEEKLTRLEVAFGLNRATTLVLTDKTRFVDQLISFHRRMFFDTHGFENGQMQSGYIENEIILSLEMLIQTLVKNYSIDALADFYIDYHKLAPFKYGNNFVIRKFLVELSTLKAFRKVTPNGLDFRVCSDSEILTLEKTKVLELFRKASKPPIPYLQSSKTWPKLPTSSMDVKGYKFLIYRNKYFIGMNGGLIEIAKIVKKLGQFLSKGFYPNEFFLKATDFRKSIFEDGFRNSIDGIDVSKDVPLFCLDIDHLTNLHMKSELPKLNQLLRERKISILDLPEIYSSLPKDRIVQKAVERIRVLKNKIIKSISEGFENKFPVQIGKAKFFMSMGGIGSGKSSLDKVARELTNNNFILASIDLSRMCSDVFAFYIATNHHSDDYRTLITFSYSLMGAIVNKAIGGNYNYFRDGSGIPYDNRNSELIKIMKDIGYETYILVAAAALYKEKDRHDITSPAHKRILDRYKLKKRAVPWDIVIDKHVNHPLAQTDASEDLHVDKMLIFDTMGKKGETSIIGFTKDVDSGIYSELKSAKGRSQKFLIRSLKTNNLLPENFVAKGEVDVLITGMINKFNFLLDSYETIYRIMIICNVTRMIDVMQKGALNINAESYEKLSFNAHKFHVPSVDYPLDARGKRDNFTLRHQRV